MKGGKTLGWIQVRETAVVFLSAPLFPPRRSQLTFLSAEASADTPRACVCVRACTCQSVYGFPLQCEMNLKIMITIRQTSISLFRAEINL